MILLDLTRDSSGCVWSGYGIKIGNSRITIWQFSFYWACADFRLIGFLLFFAGGKEEKQ